MQKGGKGIYLPLPATLVPPLQGELVDPPLSSSYIGCQHLPPPLSSAFSSPFPSLESSESEKL